MNKKQVVKGYRKYGWTEKMFEDLNTQRLKNGYPSIWVKD